MDTFNRKYNLIKSSVCPLHSDNLCPRLPVSNIHVVLTCHPWPSTDVGDLKVSVFLIVTFLCHISFVSGNGEAQPDCQLS